nr:hypothetical protein [Tanacetum cinerariifolium]
MDDSLTPRPEDIKYFKKKEAFKKHALMMLDDSPPRHEDIKYLNEHAFMMIGHEDNKYLIEQAFMKIADSLTPGPEDIKHFKKKHALMRLGDSLTPEEYFKQKHELKMLVGMRAKFLIKMPPRRNKNNYNVYEHIMAIIEERLHQLVDQFANRMNDMMNPRRRGDRNVRRSKGEESKNPFFEGDGSSLFVEHEE